MRFTRGNQVQKFLSCLFAVERSGEVRRYGQRVLLLHAAHLHAQVLRLNHNHHSQRVQRALDTILDLGSQSLLYLQSAGKNVHHACNLAQSCYASVGDVRHVCLAEERQHVVFAQRVELDIFYHHHLLVIFLKQCRPKYGFGVFFVSFGQELQRLAYTVRRALQSFAFGIFAQQAERRFYALRYLIGYFCRWVKCL